MSTVRHVEMYDSITFCGEDDSAEDVPQGFWHHGPEPLKKATCSDCLGRIADLGAVAATQLAALEEGGDVVSLRLSEGELTLLMSLLDFHAYAFEHIELAYRRRGDKADMQTISAGTGLAAIYARLGIAKRSIAPSAAPAISSATLPPKPEPTPLPEPEPAA